MPSTNQAAIAESERLKALGNELYMKSEYDAAHHQFSEAIKKNPENAILYANRAAVLLATKQYLNAVYDCRKAVQLDPAYSKAWGRLATAQHALASYPNAVEAWKEALSSLPTSNLTPAQAAMKLQFKQGLAKSALAARADIETDLVVLQRGDGSSQDDGKQPWDMARKLTPRKEAEGRPTCVYLMNSALIGLKTAMDMLAQVQAKKDTRRGGEIITGPVKVIESFTNSSLTDDRVFHVTEGAQSWIKKMERQCYYENNVWKGWCTSGGPSFMKEDAVKRLRKEGWKGVRPALATTVRIWLFQANFRAHMFGQRDFAHEMYTNALDILEWGRKTWPNVPAEERGSMFEMSFIQGVKKAALLNMHSIVSSKGKDSPISLQELIDAAESLIEDVERNTLPQRATFPLSHILAHWLYPRAIALSTLGWCYLEQGIGNYPANLSDPAAPMTDDDEASLLSAAAECYLNASRYLPYDDEMRVKFLRKHLECLCAAGKPLRETLPVARQIREAGVPALEIWGAGPHLGDGLRENLREVREFEEKWEKEIREGRRGLEDVEAIGFLKKGVSNMVPVVIRDEDNGEEKEETSASQ
ncbi:hypothetical protein D9611_005139 [Ephemerocybe angulata]|uniref:TPR-like protein n=1 Tax=Ephemerocybe angulata TaxID=980116 RepID=A0A8H5C2G4_9AGAR|nr:hypothetical protein D9611_005139 [Tulosesus angulatus]